MRSFPVLPRPFLTSLCCAVLLTTVFLNTEVLGFTYYATPEGTPFRWNLAALPNSTVCWQADPSAPDILRRSLSNAAQAWSAALGGILMFSEGTGGITVTWDGDGSLIPNTDLLAYTSFNADISGDISSARIIVNAKNYNWVYSCDGVVLPPNASVKGQADLASVILHEMGHALGLNHSDLDPSKIVGGYGYDNLPTMNSVILPGAQKLHTDDKAGIRFIYTGNGTPVPEVETSPLVVMAKPPSGRAPVRISFMQAGGDASTTWDFGDGTAACGTKVVHRFTASGTYVVTAQSGGKSGTYNVQVTGKQNKQKKASRNSKL